MKKSIAYTIAIIILLLLIGVCSFTLFKESNGSDGYQSTWATTVEVSQGVPDKECCVQDFGIDENGTYTLHFQWLPEGTKVKDLDTVSAKDLGFLTTLVVFDKNGDEVYATEGLGLTVDTQIELTAGLYHAEYHYLTTQHQYEEFAKTYMCGSHEAPRRAKEMASVFASLQTNGTYKMAHEFSAHSKSAISNLRLSGAILGLMIGFGLAFLMLLAITKGNRMQSPQYDERQELLRGRGFRYGFFSLLCFEMILFCLDMSDVFPGFDFSYIYCAGMFFGIMVHVVYCIWNEAYFALNQKTSTVMIMFGSIFLLNLVVTILNILDGSMYHNGQFGPSFLNLMCTLMFLTLFVTVVLKKIAVARQNAFISEEDEEDE